MIPPAKDWRQSAVRAAAEVLVTQPVAAKAERPGYLQLARAALGIVILTVVCVWVVREGSVRRANFETLAWSTLLSVATGVLQALTLKVISRAYRRDIAFGQAFQITALGTLGNSTGGLPIGTAFKFAILHRHVGLKLSEIAIGLGAFTVGNAVWLLMFASLAVLALDVGPDIKTVPAVLLLLAAIPVVVTWLGLARWPRVPENLKPFMHASTLTATAGLSFAISCLFILNAYVVALVLLPEHELAEIVFICASGNLASVVTLLQSVGGVQEIAMALMAYAMGAKAVEGAQIALVLRGTSALSSSLILGGTLVQRHVKNAGAGKVA